MDWSQLSPRGPLVEAYRYADSFVPPATLSQVTEACALPPSPTSSLAHLPLVVSPTPALLLVLGYLVLTLVSCTVIRVAGWRPREKDPVVLKAYTLGHNLVLLCLSAFLSISIPVEALRLKYSFWGNPYRPSEEHMAVLIYLFYVSKFMEFGDTLIMVLRISTRQVSFLHVYHHSTIALIWWAITCYAPGGDAYFSATLNSGVHVAMYGYYFLAALVGKSPALRKKYLFWGKYLTQMQMTQFVFMMCQAAYLLRTSAPQLSCLSVLLLVYMCTLLGLFGHFYVSKYYAGRQEAALLNGVNGHNGKGHGKKKKL